MKIRLVVASLLMLTGAAPAIAAGKDAPSTDGRAGASDAGMQRMIRSESKQPMDMNAPMPTGMAKKGMKKGDVKARAMKKEAVMDEMMKREEMKH